MNAGARRKLSKFLSYVLRHNPAAIGITLDEAGWTPVPELLEAAAKDGKRLSLDDLREIVATSDKKRFALSGDEAMIRANQGHSVEVELGLESVVPPNKLFHGTPTKFVDAIREAGLLKMSRHAVHLSPDIPTASAVGSRRGKPVILEVRAGEMHEAGFEFQRSANGVWLVEHVPPEYIDFPK